MMLKRKNAFSKSPLCCEDRKIVSDEPVTWKERYCAPASSILCACLEPGFFIPETRPTMTTGRRGGNPGETSGTIWPRHGFSERRKTGQETELTSRLL